MVLDSRGERDVFREDYPILGARQWTFIDEVFARLPADVDALAVVTRDARSPRRIPTARRSA